MEDNFDLRKFLLDTFFARKDVITLSEKGEIFTKAMVDFEESLSETQKRELDEAMTLQFFVHREEMEKLVDWCVKILRK